MKIVTLDFETYYDRDYSLSKMTTEEYIRDDRFEVIGLAVKKEDKPTKWVLGQERVKSFLSHIDLSEYAILCHNTAFDGAILNSHKDREETHIIGTIINIDQSFGSLNQPLSVFYSANRN